MTRPPDSRGRLGGAGAVLLYLAGVLAGALAGEAGLWTLLIPPALRLLGLGVLLLSVYRPGRLAASPGHHAILGNGLLLLLLCFVAIVGGGLSASYQFLDSDARFNLALVLLLLVFIVAAVAIAATFTLLFVAAFDRLSSRPVEAFLRLLPLLVLLAPPGVLLLGRDGDLSDPERLTGLCCTVLDLLILGGIAFLVLLRVFGAFAGRKNMVVFTAWKLLRSQRLVPDGPSGRLLRLRGLVPSVGARTSGGLWLLLLFLPCAGLLLRLPLLGHEWAGYLRVLKWLLALFPLFAALRLFVSAELSAGELLRFLFVTVTGTAVFLFSNLEGLPSWYLSLAVALTCLVTLLASAHAGLRLLLLWRRRCKTLGPLLDPALAPSVHSRFRRGVGSSMFISVVGTAVGVWALIVVLSVMKGFSADLTEKILRSREHVLVIAKDEARGIPDPFGLAERLGKLPGIREAMPFVEGNIMTASGSNIGMNVTLRGILPASFAGRRLDEDLVAGALEFLERPELLVPEGPGPLPAPEKTTAELAVPADRPADFMEMPPIFPTEDAEAQILPPVILGAELASSLSVQVGSEIELIAPDAEQGPAGLAPKARTFRVAGLFSTGLYELDMKQAFTTLWEAERFLNLGAVVNRMELRLQRLEDAITVTPAVSNMIPGAEVRDWRDMNRSLFSALQLEWLVMFFVLGFVVLIASFSTVSGLLMILKQRSATVAMLRTMGMEAGRIRALFLWLGVLLGLLGAFSGAVMGVASCLLIENLGLSLPREYYIKQLPVDMEPASVLLIAASAWLLTILASIYPAKKASGLNVVQGLNYGK